MSTTPPTTNVPGITWNNGVPTVPTEQEILAGRAADFQAAFGAGLNTAPTTPQGQVIASDTAIIGDANANIALVATMVDPNFAEGPWQDAIGSIYFLQRIAAAGSVVTCVVIGAVNTTIPAGALMQDPSGYLWAATGAIAIGSSGSASGTFQCQTQGPIALGSGIVCTPYSSVAGWDRVTTAAAAAEGRLVESRAQFENRRRQSVAINSHGTTQTIQANLLAVSGVLSAVVIDNPTGAVVDVGPTSYPLAAHSLVASVYGGTSANIASAIFTGKDGGCAYNGNTSSTVSYTLPSGTVISYTITWLTPTPVAAAFLITLTNNSSLPAAIDTEVQTAVLGTFSGTDGSVPAGIYSTIYASRYYTGLNAIDPSVEIVSVLVGTATTVTSESVGTGNGTTTAFSHTAADTPVIPGSVTITAGSVVATDNGSGLLTGTGVSGGTINYTTGAVSITYATAPANAQAITMAYTAIGSSSTTLAMGIDQIPTLQASDIGLILQ